MDFKDVFHAHPNVSELYVVDGMPFLDETSANNFAGNTKEVVTHKREVAEAEVKLDAKAKAAADAKAKV